jgi:hypothetical protein
MQAQITTPQVKAGFGIDGELKANYFSGYINTLDDWFKDTITGSGIAVIDTFGAAALLSSYNSTPASRLQTFIRTMAYPPFSTVNGNRLVDAVFVRDYHGDDSTVFGAGSNKNGMSPANWTAPVAQSVPDKNEILDAFIHVRRGGVSGNDSLWMFGGISIQNTNGNHYFDFEMYQTDIVFNRATQQFTGFGPDAGHTSWKFDINGNIIQAGDIIFTAEYNSASLTSIQARIWVNKNDIATIDPVTFNWSGSFDGANNSAQFGYAGIQPETAGAFYSGLLNGSNEWAGPFGLVLRDNSVVQNYATGQFMEFSVNLTKLGLDPVTLLGGTTCNRPFRKVMIKTRASTSFTSELKDFVAPFDFSKIPEADIFANIPFFCGVIGVSNLSVTNVVPTSIYRWNTPDGHIADSTNPKSIIIDMPGTYIVEQFLQEGCLAYATDTFTVLLDTNCGILNKNQLRFSATFLPVSKSVSLIWEYRDIYRPAYYQLERSIDGINYDVIAVLPEITGSKIAYTDYLLQVKHSKVFYRLKVMSNSGSFYSAIQQINIPVADAGYTFHFSLHPSTDAITIILDTRIAGNIQFELFNINGTRLMLLKKNVMVGNNQLHFDDLKKWKGQVLLLKATMANKIVVQKLLVE